MIEKVYIINEAGVAMFSRTYNMTLKDDDMMISAFLLAISQFAKQVSQKGDVEEIKLADIIFKYKRIGNLTIIFRISGIEMKQDVDHKLNQIGTIFLRKYQSKIDDWNGKLSEFKDFSKNTDQIIQTQNEEIIIEIIDIIDQQLVKKNKVISQYLENINEFQQRILMLGLNENKLINSINEWREEILKINFSMFSDEKLREFQAKFDEWKSLVLKGHKNLILEKLNALDF
ncbi:MAG: hypothetical protein EAX96_14320 [Candidatus Lokiarchaeota archaeon]|nr:hypothetical protein [Candidatus Lokiarchaeota archaeon]